MRLFVREGDGAERVYDFEDTELGVRESQRVAIVRAQMNKVPAPITLMLFNLSSAQHDTFEAGLRLYLMRPPLFGPAWKAFALSVVLALTIFLAARLLYRYNDFGAGFLALALGGVSFPALAWLWRAWERIAAQVRYRAQRKRFVSEMAARVQAYAR
jgi:hypothetical protein